MRTPHRQPHLENLAHRGFQNPIFLIAAQTRNPQAFSGREPDSGQAKGQAHTLPNLYTHTGPGPEAALTGMEDPGWLDGDLGGCD